MAGRSTGEVERLLELPASTLRFWEREVPFISPRKDLGGRRVYSVSDICLLLRLRHLALQKKLGLGKAARRLEVEIVSGDPELRAEIAQARGAVVGLYFEALALRENLEQVFSPPEKDPPH